MNGTFVGLGIGRAHEEIACGNSGEIWSGYKGHRGSNKAVWVASAVTGFIKSQYSPAMTSPLTGITILDLTRVLSGPYCTMLLADMGARVVKVEQPDRATTRAHWGPPFLGGESAYFLSINRNKESVTLDFKQPEGRALLDRLDREGRRPRRELPARNAGALGLDYETLAPCHPRLIYCSISGFGQTGPAAIEPGYDAVLQAEGGLMSITGAPTGRRSRGRRDRGHRDRHVRGAGHPAGAHARERTGRGQQVDVSMLDSVAALLTYQAGIHFATGRRRCGSGNRHPTIVPTNLCRIRRRVRAGRRQRRAVAALLRSGRRSIPRRRFATIRQRVTGLCRTAGPSSPIELASATPRALDRAARLRRRPVRIGPRSPAASPIRNSRPATWSADAPTPPTDDFRELGTPTKLSDTPAAVRAAPPTPRSAYGLGAGAGPGPRRRGHRPAAGHGGGLMEFPPFASIFSS